MRNMIFAGVSLRNHPQGSRESAVGLQLSCSDLFVCKLDSSRCDRGYLVQLHTFNPQIPPNLSKLHVNKAW